MVRFYTLVAFLFFSVACGSGADTTDSVQTQGATEQDATGQDPTGEDTPQEPQDAGIVVEIPEDTYQEVELDTHIQVPTPVKVATWNLRNFSEFGDAEFRIPAIVDVLSNLDADIVVVQELLPKSLPTTEGLSAVDVIGQEAGYSVLHGDWQAQDTSVGILYRSPRVTLLESREIFTADKFAFPRPPVLAEFRVGDAEGSLEFNVITLHLKAFDEGLERRRDACVKLNAFVQAQESEFFVIAGDLNDSPDDTGDANIFATNFLNPPYVFLTDALPEKTSTCTASFHYVNNLKVNGLFLDHIIVTEKFAELFGSWEPEVLAVPPPEWDSWTSTHSDHFPVYVEFTP